MTRYLRKEVLYAILTLVCGLYVYLLSADYSAFRNALNRELSKHKEFLFMLENLTPPSEELTEKGLRRTLSALGIEPKSISQTPAGIEVVISELKAVHIPELILSLEDKGKVVSFRAEDNTGKGKFSVRFVIKPY